MLSCTIRGQLLCLYFLSLYPYDHKNVGCIAHYNLGAMLSNGAKWLSFPSCKKKQEIGVKEQKKHFGKSLSFIPALRSPGCVSSKNNFQLIHIIAWYLKISQLQSWLGAWLRWFCYWVWYWWLASMMRKFHRLCLHCKDNMMATW